jgi:prepilin-type N-terminal cleavage/methylation domain-containing protein/prepilin-type processing-associated H-X9-DG protein
MTKARQAFTLIELLVVISIIALLIALLLPALKSARDSARTAVCMSQQRQMVTAQHAYAGDYRGTFRPPFWSSPREWYRALQPEYIQGPDDRMMTQVFACPAAPNASENVGRRWDQNNNDDWHADNGRYWVSYVPAQVTAGRQTGTPPSQRYFTGLQEVGPSQAMFFERADFKPGNSAVDDQENQVELRDYVYPLHYIQQTRTDRPPFLELRHGGGESQNIAFADGSVASVRGEQIEQTFLDGVASHGSWNKRRWEHIVRNIR